MKYTIIILVVAFILWKGRHYIKGWVINFKEKRKNKITPIDDELIYTPIASSRTFNFDITIDELGNGKVKIGIANKK